MIEREAIPKGFRAGVMRRHGFWKLLAPSRLYEMCDGLLMNIGPGVPRIC